MYQAEEKINYVNFWRFDKNLVLNGKFAKLLSASKSVYPVIAVHCDKKGYCFPGQQTIAELAGCARKTVGKGIKGLYSFPSITIKYKNTKTGHRQMEYFLENAPDERGRTFALHKCIFISGIWSRLSSSEHALYIAMRASCFFERDPYLAEEGIECDADGSLFDNFFTDGHFAKRKYDFVDAETDILIERAGIGRSSAYVSFKNLEKAGLIEKTESIRDYDTDTWKVYRII